MSVLPRKVLYMSTALYRRYRPDDFASVIGQEQVTKPLIAALESNRVTHAYLFSGPRGCGKTTSARILARCLNCAEGPTATPCGKCDSCKELATGGSGSLDVVEIDAASHNGVDDARELRERAAFAPARDRYKIFILDEAHMVTTQGFNALLKLVEEPPEHVKFIFATTEPDKVIGTIRSRTHHYPFRLVPPEVLESYLQELCDKEGIEPMPGVLPLVLRAGGGSVRDTLSVLDQLMAGAVDNKIDYHLALALLGYTDSALLDGVTQALSEKDGNRVYDQVEQMVESGHDPRRFVEDLLQRLRDLLILAVAGEGAKQVLHSLAPDQVERMLTLAQSWGAAGISRAADLTSQALNQMAGATSPRLQLELLCARILLPDSHSSAEATAPGTAGLAGPSAPASGGRGAVEGRGGSGGSGVSGAQKVREQLAKQQRAQAGSGTDSAESARQEPAGMREPQPPTPTPAEGIPVQPMEAVKPAEPAVSKPGWGTPATPGGGGEEPGADMAERFWGDIIAAAQKHNPAQGKYIADNLRPGKVHQGNLDIYVPSEEIAKSLTKPGSTFVSVMNSLVKEVLQIDVKVSICVYPKKAKAPAAGLNDVTAPASAQKDLGNEPAQPAGGMSPVGPAAPVEPAEPASPVEPSEPSEPAASAEPAEPVAQVLELKPGITGQIPQQNKKEDPAWAYQLVDSGENKKPESTQPDEVETYREASGKNENKPANNGWGPVREIPGSNGKLDDAKPEAPAPEEPVGSRAQAIQEAAVHPQTQEQTGPEPASETDNSIDPDDPEVAADEVGGVEVIQSLLGGTVIETIEN